MFQVFTQSFKHFKDQYFKVSIKPGCSPWFVLEDLGDGDVSARFELYWTQRHYQRRPKDYSTREAALTSAERRGFEVLMAYVGENGIFDLRLMVDKSGEELLQAFGSMAGGDFRKFLKKGGGRGKAAQGAPVEGAPSKRPRLTPGEASSTPAPISLDPPRSPQQAAPESPPGEAIFLESGELWRKGVSDGIRAVIRPPMELLDGSPLTLEMMARLGRMEEDALKLGSLIQAFKELNMGYSASCSTVATLSVRAQELSKEKEELESALRARSGLEAEVEELKASLARAEEQSRVFKSSSKNFEAGLAAKEKELSDLRIEFEEARAMVETAAVGAFESAIEQARVLNPGLISDGMDVTCIVKDGRIVPGSPDEEEVTELVSAPPTIMD